MSKKIFAGLMILTMGSNHAQACLWDYDTLAQELAGLPNLKSVIAGGFVRNPPLYYEMRIKRLVKLLAENPDDLDAYDGIAVACDRVGRSGEAIDWMVKKKQALDRLKYDGSKHPQPNHMYRYYANLGTFHGHRWIRNKAQRVNLSDLKKAKESISKSIKDNPDAHFGREKIQLRAISWLLDLFEKAKDERIDFESGFPNMLGISSSMRPSTDDNDQLKEAGLEDSIDGLSGLIVMGDAWESVDIFYALAQALQTDGKSSVAFIALQRCKDLIDDGRSSIVPGSPTGNDLKKSLSLWSLEGGVENKQPVIEEYNSMKAQATLWHNRRTRYMMERLTQGEHPDTHPSFWDQFEGDHQRAEIKSESNSFGTLLIVVLIAFAGILIVSVPWIRKLGKT